MLWIIKLFETKTTPWTLTFRLAASTTKKIMALRLMLIVSCIIDDILEAAGDLSDANEHQNVVDYNRMIGKQKTDKQGTPWFIDCEGIPRSIRQFDPFPIFDARRASAFIMMAQQYIPKLRIDEELHQIIVEFSGHNEIRALFRMFTTSQDTMNAFGFPTYEAMHQQYPMREDKVQYLTDFKHRWDGITGMLKTTIIFGLRGRFIREIRIRKIIWFDEHQCAFNWDAITEFVHLAVLELAYLKISVSFENIERLPTSLRVLNLDGNVGTSSMSDGSLHALPVGLRRFSMDNCNDMNWVLQLDAPHSNLKILKLWATNIRLHVHGEDELPRMLKFASLPVNVDVAIIQILKKLGVRAFQIPDID